METIIYPKGISLESMRELNALNQLFREILVAYDKKCPSVYSKVESFDNIFYPSHYHVRGNAHVAYMVRELCIRDL